MAGMEPKYSIQNLGEIHGTSSDFKWNEISSNFMFFKLK
jgi:hypothetical protein